MSNAIHRPGHVALRRGRVSLPGQVYLVTFTTEARRPLFARFWTGAVASAAMVDGRLWRDARLLAWVLMPDHWHGLIELGSRDSLGQVVQRLKVNSARRVRAGAGVQCRVWARGFHDHGLRQEEGLRNAARYVVGNPIRAGLVERAGDYPFWGANWVNSDAPPL
ncbi:REP-associated tyrosine transposase [Lysobacter sp. A3-1-A15]|uniref:REP-associated tyrosine transposase n=1 Tax=Novilysobacter viscosus TaxID=3098602 RepID=UPI002ED8C988